MAQILTELTRVLRQFVETVGGEKPLLAVIGGLAVSVHTEPRFTRDADLAVHVATDADAERLIFGLQQQGYQVLSVFEHERGRMSTVRLVPPNGSVDGVLVDLLFASSGIEAELVQAAVPIEVLPGLVLPVARIGHLIALKLLSVDAQRPKDQQDLIALMREANDGEIAMCEEAMMLMTARGYHRGRDLAGAFKALQHLSLP